MDPFQMALDAMFQAPGSSDALYVEPGALARTIRVIPAQPTERSRFGAITLPSAASGYQIRRSEVSEVATGAALIIGELTHAIKDKPLSDIEGLTWTVLVDAPE